MLANNVMNMKQVPPSERDKMKPPWDIWSQHVLYRNEWIREHVPDATIVTSVREPMSRFWSDWVRWASECQAPLSVLAPILI
jgi:hypothetical protein